MRKEQFVEGEFYHIYDRGVDKRPIFMDDRDRIRFIHTAYVLNNFQEIPKQFDIFTLSPRELLVPIEPLIEVVAGCLMITHYHMKASPRVKNGISKFFHKFGTSYTMYFNKRHNRTGSLLEGPFRAKRVDRHEYASYLTQYIHLNSVELFPDKSGEELLREIENYPWSSLPDYLGRKSHWSILLSPSFRDEVLDMDAEEYRQSLHDLFWEKYGSHS